MMIKSFTLRLAGIALVALVSWSAAGAQTAGKDLVLDFRTSTAVEGMADSGIVTGHMVSSPTKVRIDMSTIGGRAPTPLLTDGPVSMIVSNGA